MKVVLPLHSASGPDLTAQQCGKTELIKPSEPVLTKELYGCAEQAMAAHNSGGLVIVQVERVVERGSLPPRLVHLPAALVDKVGALCPSSCKSTQNWPSVRRRVASQSCSTGNRVLGSELSRLTAEAASSRRPFQWLIPGAAIDADRPTSLTCRWSSRSPRCTGRR